MLAEEAPTELSPQLHPYSSDDICHVSPLHRHPHHDSESFVLWLLLMCDLRPHGFPLLSLLLDLQGLLHGSSEFLERARPRPTQALRCGSALWLNSSFHLSYTADFFSSFRFQMDVAPSEFLRQAASLGKPPTPGSGFSLLLHITVLFINVLMIGHRSFWPQGNDQEVT